MDAIIHLGGIAGEAAWGQLLRHNVEGTVNVFEAARRAGVTRLIYASTNHVTGLYPAGRVISGTSPPRPDSRYGLSKGMGEEIAAFYAYKYSIRTLCIRIGSFTPRPQNRRALSTWISQRDMLQLVQLGLTADYRFEIIYGVSGNTRSWWDNTNAIRLGYRPVDNAENYADMVENIVSDVPLERAFQGGDRVSEEFAGTLDWLNR